MEVMGNLLDNACKYCLEFVEVSARVTDNELHIIVEDDGPAFPVINAKWCSIAASAPIRCGRAGRRIIRRREIVDQYEGKIETGESLLGGARMEVILAASIPYRTIVDPECENTRISQPGAGFRYNPTQ